MPSLYQQGANTLGATGSVDFRDAVDSEQVYVGGSVGYVNKSPNTQDRDETAAVVYESKGTGVVAESVVEVVGIGLALVIIGSLVSAYLYSKHKPVRNRSRKQSLSAPRRRNQTASRNQRLVYLQSQ